MPLGFLIFYSHKLKHAYPINASRKQTQSFLNQACYNADQRYLNNKTLSSAFLYAVLLWWPLKKATIKLRPRDRDYPKSSWLLLSLVINEQQKTLKLPKKIIEGIMQIWQLQLSFMEVSMIMSLIVYLNHHVLKRALI